MQTPNKQFNLVRIPIDLNVRFERQVRRLQCSKNAFVKMALVKLIEEEEAKEKQTQSLSKKEKKYGMPILSNLL